MNSAEYVVSFKRSQQIAENEWDTWTEQLKVTGSTTVQEIVDWHNSKYQFEVPCNGLSFNQLEEIKKL